MFLVLKWDRWYSAVFELLVNEVRRELRATLGREGVSGRAQLRRDWGRRGATGADGAKAGCVDGTEVPCIRRWEEVWVGTGDRMKGFRCDA